MAHMAMKFPGEFTLKKSPQFLRFLLLGSEGWGTWPEILGARKLLKINCGEVQKFRAGDHQFYDFFVEIMIMPTHSSFPIIWLRFISYFFLAKSPPQKKNITKNKKRRQQGCLGFCVVEPLDGLEVHLRKNSNGVERRAQQVDSSYHAPYGERVRSQLQSEPWLTKTYALIKPIECTNLDHLWKVGSVFFWSNPTTPSKCATLNTKQTPPVAFGPMFI